MTKAEIKEKLWIMENFCKGKSKNVDRNEVLGIDKQSDFYAMGKADAYKDMAERIGKLKNELY